MKFGINRARTVRNLVKVYENSRAGQNGLCFWLENGKIYVYSTWEAVRMTRLRIFAQGDRCAHIGPGFGLFIGGVYVK